MKKAKYNFVFNRKNKVKKNGRALIQLEIYAGWRKFISTGIEVEPQYWDAKKRRIKNTHPMHILHNKALTDFQQYYENIEYACINEGVPFTLASITKQPGNDTGNFLAWAEAINDADKTIGYSTQIARRAGIRTAIKYGGFTTFGSVTYDNVLAYDNWLHKQGFSGATIAKRHAYIKLFIRKAMPGLIKDDPYSRFKISRPKTDKIRFLEASELQQIEALTTFNKSLNFARDLFLFQCYTGVSYVDLMQLTPRNIVTDAEGDKLLVDHRQKTGEGFQVYLSAKALQIIERNRTTGASLFKYITNQKYNAALKKLETLANTRHITSHMGRHTFAVNYLERNNGDIKTLQRILGQSSLASTEIYAKVLRSSIKRGMQNMG